jgi:hypothetical protein
LQCGQGSVTGVFDETMSGQSQEGHAPTAIPGVPVIIARRAAFNQRSNRCPPNDASKSAGMPSAANVS